MQGAYRYQLVSRGMGALSGQRGKWMISESLVQWADSDAAYTIAIRAWSALLACIPCGRSRRDESMTRDPVRGSVITCLVLNDPCILFLLFLLSLRKCVLL